MTAFWVTMNVLLWRLEFGDRGGDTQVPPQLVWHKILTAPDASSLSVYQKGERMGYCEFSTGVGQQMATFEEGKPPPEGFVAHAGYQLHMAGNVSLGDFTNRIKFDGRMRFNRFHQWEELNFRITSRTAVIEISSQATNELVHVKMTSEGATVLQRNLTFGDLQNPGAIMRLIAGNALGDFLGVLDTSEILPGDEGQALEWDARRTRVKIDTQAVPVYRLETSVLGHPIVVDVSTLGEILRIDLPDNISARIDEWSKP
ncbi:MAG: hypothetical protein ABSH48_02075 [Verrucomicrobiota bacterium]